MLLFECRVEFFCNFFAIKGVLHPAGDAGQRKRLFLLKRESYLSELLNKPFGVFVGMPDMLSKRIGLAFLPRYPLPNLLCFFRVSKDNEMLENALGNLTFELLPNVALWDGLAMKDAEFPFMSNGIKCEILSGNSDFFRLT